MGFDQIINMVAVYHVDPNKYIHILGQHCCCNIAIDGIILNVSQLSLIYSSLGFLVFFDICYIAAYINFKYTHANKYTGSFHNLKTHIRAQ